MILTNQDLSDHENRRNCCEEFRIARDMAGIAALSQWALKWGEAVCGELAEPEIDPDVIEYHVNHDLIPIRAGVEAEIKRLEGLAKVHKGTSSAVVIYTAIENLEKAISE